MSDKRTRRRGRRSARRAAHNGSTKVELPTYITRQIPRHASVARYELLGEEGLQRLEDHAEWIMSEIGIEFRGDEEALRLFKEAGASVKGARVRFDKGHVRALCATAPSEFKMHGRNTKRTVIFGGKRVVFALWTAFCQRFGAGATIWHHQGL